MGDDVFISWSKWLIFLYWSCLCASPMWHFNFQVDNQSERIHYTWSKLTLESFPFKWQTEHSLSLGKVICSLICMGFFNCSVHSVLFVDMHHVRCYRIHPFNYFARIRKGKLLSLTITKQKRSFLGIRVAMGAEVGCIRNPRWLLARGF